MKIPVLYTTLYTFEYLLLEGVRCISIEKLKKHRQMEIENEKRKYELGYILQLDNSIATYPYKDMTFEEEEQEFQKMIQTHTDLFHVEDDNLVLNDGITDNDILAKKRELLQSDPFSFYLTDAMRFLGITKMLDFIDQVNQVEKETESLYQQLAFHPDEESIQKQIAKNLMIRSSAMNILQHNGWDTLFIKISDGFVDDVPNRELLFRIIDKDYFQNNPFFELPEDIDESLSNQMMYQLLNRNSIAAFHFHDTCRLNFFADRFGVFNNIYSFEELIARANVLSLDDIDIEDFSFEEPQKAKASKGKERKSFNVGDRVTLAFDVELFEQLFYLIYLKKVNELLDGSLDESLLFLKGRLLYLLDKPEYALFHEENIDAVIEKISMLCSFEMDDIEDYSYVAYFFTDELFHKPSEDEHTQKKLIYICTYYALTNDPYIREILDQYKSHPKYQEYLAFITDMPFGTPTMILQHS